MAARSPTQVEETSKLPARPRRARTAVVLAALVAAAGLSVLFSALSLHIVGSGNSDGATVILEGVSVRNGHLLLGTWSLSLDSFWLADVPFYALAVLVAGVRSQLINVVPAVIAALVVVAGVHLATAGRRGRAMWVGGGAVVALLALPSHLLAFFLLQGPLHVATVLWCLCAFACLRQPRFGWCFALAVVLLAAAMLSDLQAAALGLAPVALAGIAESARRRRLLAGAIPVAAAAASALLALLVRLVADAVGTFAESSPQQSATRHQMSLNVQLAVTETAKMLGVGHGALVSGGVPEGLQAVHVVGVIAVVGAVLVALIRFGTGVADGERLDRRSTHDAFLEDVLVLAALADLAVFVVLSASDSVSYVRYLTAAVIFASVLTARLAGEVARRLRSNLDRRLLAAGAAAVALCFAAGLGFELAEPGPVQTTDALAGFLSAHHLTEGLGDYWSASVVTVASNGKVAVRPVIVGTSGKLIPYNRNTNHSWYAGQRFSFFVWDPASPFGGADTATAVATFGPPAHTYREGGYQVLVWNRSRAVPLAPGS
ncbi:MAG: hypothetical protein JWM85_583 [Acidimicrobiaceae bacterium]|nr:hypothetical protein [Acidimicrobiaceae bacterium]